MASHIVLPFGWADLVRFVVVSLFYGGAGLVFWYYGVWCAQTRFIWTFALVMVLISVGVTLQTIH